MGPQPGRHRRKAGESVRSLVARLERAGVCFPLNSLPGDLPGGPGLRICLPVQGMRVQSLTGELRSMCCNQRSLTPQPRPSAAGKKRRRRRNSLLGPHAVPPVLLKLPKPSGKGSDTLQGLTESWFVLSPGKDPQGM